MTDPKTDPKTEVRSARALERIATALEQLVLLQAHAPTTTALARLRVALVRVEKPAQVVSLWRRASAEIPPCDHDDAWDAAITRLVQVGGGAPDVADDAKARAWLSGQIRPAEGAGAAKAGGGRSAR